jgi:hypothetical protein
MTPEDARRLARQRVRARKQRTRGIRRRVVAITLSLFVAAWVAIFVNLVSGHDPALGSSRQTAKAAGGAATSRVSTAATQTAAAERASAARARAEAKAKASAAAAAAAQAASSDPGTGGSSTDTSSSGSGSTDSSSGSSSGSSSSAAPVTTSQS